MANGPYIDRADYIETEKYKKTSNIDIYIPKSGISEPKDSDYQRGYMYRYFYQQSNNKKAQVKEIVEKEYNKIKNNYLYRVLKIKWKIIGNAQDATNINSKVIEVADKILNGIKDIVSNDLLKFWKNIPDAITKFDVTNKLPKSIIKKKRYNVDLVAVVSFDDAGFVYILTEDLDIIYTEDAVGILAQLI